MKQGRDEFQEGEAFAAQAAKRASEELAAVRMRGETVRDEGDFLARAMDQIYMDASRERRAQARRRGHS